jgi:homoserine dehydrogenase
MTKIALIGFGVVGQALTQLIKDKNSEIYEKYGFDIEIVAISGRSKGSVYDPEGLDLDILLKKFRETGSVEAYPEGVKGLSSIETIINTNAEIILEVTSTNIETGEPALTHVKTALNNAKHVVTSNKGPPALAYKELKTLANQNIVEVRIESTVLSGTPAINFATENLAGHRIYGFKGIINGTTNYILTKMEQGEIYEKALKEAQELGYAEADPTADVEGWDAVAKTIILANAILGGELKVSDVEREGITDISSERIRAAKSKGKRIKLIAEAYSENGVVRAKVGPKQVPLTNPFAVISGTLNALTVITDGLGDVTVIGGGAGGEGTAHGLLSDIIAIFRVRARTNSSRHLT